MKFLLASSLFLLSSSSWAFTTPSTPRHPTTRLSVATDPTVDLLHPAIAPFGRGQTAAKPLSKDILGGKGANLAVMTSLGLPVPPGFTLTTECCDRFGKAWQNQLPDSIWQQVLTALRGVETEMQAEFGSAENPLLLSVWSGAAISMPGEY